MLRSLTMAIHKYLIYSLILKVNIHIYIYTEQWPVGVHWPLTNLQRINFPSLNWVSSLEMILFQIDNPLDIVPNIS